MRSFSIRQEVLDVSQIAIAFHGISPPFSNYPSCSNTNEVASLTLRTAFGNSVGLGSMRCGRSVIP